MLTTLALLEPVSVSQTRAPAGTEKVGSQQEYDMYIPGQYLLICKPFSLLEWRTVQQRCRPRHGSQRTILATRDSACTVILMHKTAVAHMSSASIVAHAFLGHKQYTYLVRIPSISCDDVSQQAPKMSSPSRPTLGKVTSIANQCVRRHQTTCTKTRYVKNGILVRMNRCLTVA